MRISKTGVVLAIIYILALIACAIWAQFISDPKGQFLILQLPVSLQHAALLSVRANSLLSGMSWPEIYFVLGAPMLLVLMLLGYVIELAFSKFSLGFKHLTKQKNALKHTSS